MAKSRFCAYPKCSKLFTPGRKNQKYHTEECRKKHYDDIYFHRLLVKKICPRCGEEFETSKPLLQDYCLPECRKARHLPNKFRAEALARLEEILDIHPDRQRGYSVSNSATDTDNGVKSNFTLAPTSENRSETSTCELCGEEHTLVYHQWDKDNLSKGLWLCLSCNMFAERCDNEEYDKYQKLKQMVEEEFKDKPNKELATIITK